MSRIGVWFLVSLALHCSCCGVCLAATRYVWTDSPSSGFPYDGWSNAAHTIQDAVDVATSGDLILVTNGTYDAGGRVTPGFALINRVCITNAVTVRSVNGPAATLIKGQGPKGLGAVRCAYLNNGAALAGFTLTEGCTMSSGDPWNDQSGGGVRCPNGVVSNCVITGNTANYGGGTHQGSYFGCTLSSNTAWQGGGAFWGAFESCIITGNVLLGGFGPGGGIYDATLRNCRVMNNRAGAEGGGAKWGTLENCVVMGNTAGTDGGGAQGATVSNSIVSGNTAGGHGGGTAYGTIRNCAVMGNSAGGNGGGTWCGQIQSCTIVGNTAGNTGGGTCEGAITNSVIYHNTAGVSNDNWSVLIAMGYCCTTPDPGGGSHVTNPPSIAALDNPHLLSNSPCIDAGTTQAWMAGAADLDGETRICDSAVDIGCDEFLLSGMTGALSVAILADPTATYTNVPIRFQTSIQGKANRFVWEWGDGQGGTNECLAWHSYSSTGDYEVVLTAWNNDVSASATTTVHIVQGQFRYVSLSGAHVWPFATWSNAATNIQSAISAAASEDTVLVCNGLYDAGGVMILGSLTNRIAITNGILVRSVNGPAVTIIRGQGPAGDAAVRCAYLGMNARLAGFTLTNGYTRASGDTWTERSGGGVWCESGAVVSNCIVAGNLADKYGGGCYSGIMVNCTIAGNAATNGGGGASHAVIQGGTIRTNSAQYGGGAYACRIEGCAVASNSARRYWGDGGYGGGVYGCSVSNSILRGNYADNEGGGAYGSVIADSLIERNVLGWSGTGHGGGAYGGTLVRCTLSSNEASGGAGTYGSKMRECALVRNLAWQHGGGASDGTLVDCTVVSNEARLGVGGGISDAVASNCVMAGNSARSGGGAYSSDLVGCALIGNSAAKGGGDYGGTLANCTVVRNRGWQQGGGTWESRVVNSIVYYNTAPGSADWYDRFLRISFSCTAPDPGGPGNITNSPGLLSLSAPRLASNSPCVNAGSNQAWMAGATDLDGDERIHDATVDMGADEFVSAGMTGALSAAMVVDHTIAVVGFPLDFEAVVNGKAAGCLWTWGDGQSNGNECVAQHGYIQTGDYSVAFTAWNNDNSCSVTRVIHIVNGFTNYASLSGNHVFPFLNWADAATNIQDAITANGVGGGVVLVADGVYQGRGVVVYGAMTNRMAITNGVVVRSAGGAAVAIIRGQGPMGDKAVRCAYVGHKAQLIGFTLTNGFTRNWGDEARECNGGGVWCEVSAVVSGCVIAGCTAYDNGGGAYAGILADCDTRGNTSGNSGGGAFCSVVRGGEIAKNLAGYSGGGAYYGTVENCAVVANVASNYGGGIYYGTVRGCAVISNAAAYGGGAYGGTVENCTIAKNTATSYGGGAHDGTVRGCAIYDNWCTYSAGGVFRATVQNCTIVNNAAGNAGGGVMDGTVSNSIVYYNTAVGGPNWYSVDAMAYCCTTPDPGGRGNVSDEPRLVGFGNPHIVASSPCINAGTNQDWMAGAVDVDGETRVAEGIVDMGCDEFTAAGMTGLLRVAIVSDFTNATLGFPIDFQAVIEGKANGYVWDWGDGQTNADLCMVQHAYAMTGDFAVVLTAWNNDMAAAATAAIHVISGFTNYVALSGNHISPFTNWGDAATNVQAAISVNVVAGGVVLVSNGVYESGGAAVYGAMTNRVAVTNAITVRGLQGPGVTVIKGRGPLGAGAVRCAYVGNKARLEGFTLTNGYTRSSGDALLERSGGGAWCRQNGVVSNCVIVGNGAQSGGGGTCGGNILDCGVAGNNSSADGGGAFYGLVRHCTISNNVAGDEGGGTCQATVEDCSLVRNQATRVGGGVSQGAVTRCLISDNQVPGVGKQGGGTYGGVISECRICNNGADYGGGTAEGIVRQCVITNNVAGYAGGGTYGGTVERCVIADNYAQHDGGGARETTLRNCLVRDNIADYNAGVSMCTVENSTIVENQAILRAGGTGGGSTILNSILYYNWAPTNENWYDDSIRYSCTTPAPPAEGNITNVPRFVSQATNDYRLLYGSPCIDTGTNLSGTVNDDLAGFGRPLDGDFDGTNEFDMGAYEYDPWTQDSDGDTMLDYWEHRHGLNPTNAADAAENGDGDPHRNVEEWIADTDPGDSNAYFRIIGAGATPFFTVTFLCTNSRVYTMESGTNLVEGSPIFRAVSGLTNCPGDVTGTMALTDTNAAVRRFHRLKVQLP